MLLQDNNIYNKYDFINNINDSTFVNNRLLCTFTDLSNIDNLLSDISRRYSILYKKIFVLRVLSNDEYVCTYNIETGNVDSIIDNTVLVHRKKESNTLYSLNALNELVKTLNGGIEDKNFQINWNDYRNSILITQKGELKQLKTKIYKIVEI
jgi:hypothetical protein